MLENCKSIWNKIRNITGKKFDGKPIYGGKYLKTKLKVDFYGKNQERLSLFLFGRNSARFCV